MFLKWTDVLIANSRSVAASYAKHISKNQRVEVIYNGVDLDQFRPGGASNSKSRFKIRDKEFVIGQIGRINPKKGQDIFIKALAYVAQTRPFVRALIIGDTNIDHGQCFQEELEQLVVEQGLRNKITFTGFVEDIADLYRALDLVVIASQEEGFNRTLIEAMAVAKPVVATDSGGPLEIIQEGKTGFLVPCRNPEALAKKILRLIDDPKLASELGVNGRQRVEKHFSIEKNVKAIEGVYSSLVDLALN